MITVLLMIHFLIAAALVGVILIQRSEGGALGMGGGGFMGARGTANLLTRITTGLGTAFFASSLILALLFRSDSHTSSIVDDPKEAKTTASSNPDLPKDSDD